MSAKSNTQRSTAYRTRRAEQGLTEVKKIYARPDDHAAIKYYASLLTSAHVDIADPIIRENGDVRANDKARLDALAETIKSMGGDPSLNFAIRK
jgi:uncharacterized protein YutE (UPF0331/DUF86 family)